jgi:chorismate dehydratase
MNQKAGHAEACPSESMMRIGCVKYLNARPLIRGWPGQVAFDHPAALSDQLQRGNLQVALVSSFEFLRNPIYRIVDGVSISSDGPVYSVVVAHRGEISGIEEIELDPASLTSVALLRCLLGEIQLRPRLVTRSAPKTSDDVRAKLLIGDQAICFREKHAKEFEFWDLGEQWKKLFDLPFVYALWLVRPEWGEAKAIGDQLRALRDRNIRQIEELIAEEQNFDQEFCHRYFLRHLRFNFGEREKEGLQTFSALCAKGGLTPKRQLALNLI